LVVLTGISDAGPKFEAMASGRAHVALEPMGANIARYRAHPERFELVATPESGGGVALAMNLARPPFDDSRVRQALARALGSDAFVEAAGYGDPTAVMSTIDRADSTWHHPTIRLPECDTAAAQRLIDEVVAERGGPVRFSVQTFANEGHRREAQAIKHLVEASLSSVEVKVEVGTVPELMGKWQTGDFQATNYAVKWADPTFDLPPQFATGSPLNIMRYSSPVVDAALAELAAATDRERIADAHHRVLRQVLEDVPIVWLSYKDAYHVVDRRRVGDWNLFYSLRPLIEDARLVNH
jgi:peptide/nickel transport system substrate-binding protein